MPDSEPKAAASTVSSTVETMWATRGRARQLWPVFQRSLVPMVMVDNERRYLAANAAARLVFRLSLGEMLTRRIEDLTPPHMLATMYERWERLMRNASVGGRYDVGFPDGSELRIVYCAVANLLPGQHLIVFTPSDWPSDELAFEQPEAPGQPGTLSRREREVLTLIADGADLHQIADELTISVTTVRTHVRNALRKLGAHNRAHAIALAMQHGLIDLPPRPPSSV